MSSSCRLQLASGILSDYGPSDEGHPARVARVRVSPQHGKSLVARDIRQRDQVHAALHHPRAERLSQVQISPGRH